MTLFPPLTPEQAREERGHLLRDLKRVRENYGLSIPEVAEAAGVSRSAQWRIEARHVDSSLLHLLSVCWVLDLTLDLQAPGAAADHEPFPMQHWTAPPGFSMRTYFVDSKQTRDQLLRQKRARLLVTLLAAELWWLRAGRAQVTAAALAQHVGMTQRTLQDVETGPGWPALDSVIRVAAAHGRRVVLKDIGDRIRPSWM